MEAQIYVGGELKGLQCQYNRSMCSLCLWGASDGRVYVLFQCASFQTVQREAWTELSLKMPVAMYGSIILRD